MKESGRVPFFIQLEGTSPILGGVFRDKSELSSWEVQLTSLTSQNYRGSIKNHSKPNWEILFVATSLISHEGSQYLLGECWILELVVIVFIFSYCLAGQEALVCDDQKEVVQVKAQQVLAGEDFNEFTLCMYNASQILYL